MMLDKSAIAKGSSMTPTSALPRRGSFRDFTSASSPSQKHHNPTREERSKYRRLWRIGIACARAIYRAKYLAKNLPRLYHHERLQIRNKVEGEMLCLQSVEDVMRFVQSFGQRLSTEELVEYLKHVAFVEGKAMTLQQVMRLMLFLKRRHTQSSSSEAEEAFAALQNTTRDSPTSLDDDLRERHPPVVGFTDEGEKLSTKTVQSAIQSFGLSVNDKRLMENQAIDYSTFAEVVGQPHNPAAVGHRNQPLNPWSAPQVNPIGIARARRDSTQSNASQALTPAKHRLTTHSHGFQSRGTAGGGGHNARRQIKAVERLTAGIAVHDKRAPIQTASVHSRSTTPTAAASMRAMGGGKKSFNSFLSMTMNDSFNWDSSSEVASPAHFTDVETKLMSMQEELSTISVPGGAHPASVQRKRGESKQIDPAAHREAFPLLKRGEKWDVNGVLKRIDHLSDPQKNDKQRHPSSRNVRYCSDTKRPAITGDVRPCDIAKLENSAKKYVKGNDKQAMHGAALSAAPLKRKSFSPSFMSRPISAPVPATAQRFPALERRREAMMERLPHRMKQLCTERQGPSGMLEPELRHSIIARRVHSAASNRGVNGLGPNAEVQNIARCLVQRMPVGMESQLENQHPAMQMDRMMPAMAAAPHDFSYESQAPKTSIGAE